VRVTVSFTVGLVVETPRLVVVAVSDAVTVTDTALDALDAYVVEPP
jgi:hypothetical protein